jgi:hypothetical protein
MRRLPRPAVHVSSSQPDHFLTSAFVAFQAEGQGRDHEWAHPAAQRQQEQEQHVDRMQPQPPYVMLSRCVGGRRWGWANPRLRGHACMSFNTQ